MSVRTIEAVYFHFERHVDIVHIKEAASSVCRRSVAAPHRQIILVQREERVAFGVASVFVDEICDVARRESIKR